MDPQQTWQEMLDAYASGQLSQADELASALLDWLDKGGFPPQTFPDRTFDSDFNWDVARAAVQAILSQCCERSQST